MRTVVRGAVEAAAFVLRRLDRLILTGSLENASAAVDEIRFRRAMHSACDALAEPDRRDDEIAVAI